MSRTVESPEQIIRNSYVAENDILMQRRIAEEHIDELTRIFADRSRGEVDAHVEPAVADILYIGDLPHDLRQYAGIVDRLKRHFHALLDRNRIRPRLDRARLAPNAIEGVQSRAQCLNLTFMAVHRNDPGDDTSRFARRQDCRVRRVERRLEAYDFRQAAAQPPIQSFPPRAARLASTYFGIDARPKEAATGRRGNAKA